MVENPVLECQHDKLFYKRLSGGSGKIHSGNCGKK